MLRLNFLSRQPVTRFNVTLFALGVFMSLLVAQFFFVGIGYYRKIRVDRKVRELQSRLTELEARKAELFGKAADVMAVSGALQARNEWHQRRQRSPLKILAKIERTSPPGVILYAFSGTQSGGDLQFDVMDPEIGQLWLKDGFSGLENQMRLEKNGDGGYRISFTWRE